MLENTLFPSIGDPVTKLPECDIHDKHHFPKPQHAFTLQEQFMETVNRVNDTLARIVRQADFMKKSVDEFTSKLSADNTTFKDLVVSTYNNFSSVVTAEVNAFETEIKNSYQAFSDEVKLNWDNFQLNYADFENSINQRIDALVSNTDTAFKEYKTLVNQGFANFQEEISNQLASHKTETSDLINTHKSEMNETYNSFRDAIELRLTYYNSNYIKSFNDYCSTMNNNLAEMERDFEQNYANFTSSINASITEFKNEWAGMMSARLDGQDSVINDAVLYMKTNLTATLNQIVDELIIEGRIDTITTATYQSIKNRIPNIINVKDYFADNLTVNENGEINFEIAVELINEKLSNGEGIWNKPTLYFPNGTYLFGMSDLIIPSFVSVIGESKTGVIFKSETEGGTITLSDSSDTIEYVTLKNFSIEITLDLGIVGEGIWVKNKASHLIIDNVSVNGGSNGIYLQKGLWVSQLSNIDIANVDTGISIKDPSTSTTLKNVYVMNASEYGYHITGLGYSSWENVCADWCKGTVYYFYGCSININGLGCECQDANKSIHSLSSRLNINNATIFTNKDKSSYYMIDATMGTVVLNGVSVDTYDNETHVSQGRLYNMTNDCKLIIQSMNCKTDFLIPSTSGDPNNIFKYSDVFNDYSIANHKTFIGMPIKSGSEPTYETKHADRDYLTGSIWFNNAGHPRNGLAHDDRYALPRQCGDLFVNSQPYNTGVAMWQQVVTGEKIFIEGTKTITKEDDKTILLTISNKSFSERVKAQLGEYPELTLSSLIQNGTTVNGKFIEIDEIGDEYPHDVKLKSVFVNSINPESITDLRITLQGKGEDIEVTDTGLIIGGVNRTFSKLAELPFYISAPTDIAHTEFRAIQHLMCLTSNQITVLLMNNQSTLVDGLMVFNSTDKKPMWFYNDNFYYADGTTLV